MSNLVEWREALEDFTRDIRHEEYDDSVPVHADRYLDCDRKPDDAFILRLDGPSMSEGAPREYDLEYTAPETGPVRRRLGIDTDRGEVRRFVLQLEYLVDPAAERYATVVRYDHDAEGAAEATHDVTEAGLHIDIYREGEKVDSHELTPPLPASAALEAAEEHLAAHLEGYVRRFEEWHGITR